MKKIKFTKMQGLGNDFILVDYEKNTDFQALAEKMCDRHFGIGADGLIVVNPEDMNGSADASWHIYNSDGSEPQMCGNGIRCLTKYVYEKNLVNKKKFTVNTLAGIVIPEILEDGKVKVDMGKPILGPVDIPCKASSALKFQVNVLDRCFEANAVSMGNPHCVIFEDEEVMPLAEKYGPHIEIHPFFPEKTNVEFVQKISDSHLKLAVWERGCGITLACGTGSCATVVAAILNKLTGKKVQVDLPGGALFIEWSGNTEDSVFMTGDAEFVFEGEYFAD